MLLEPQAIFPENVKDVVADGFTTADKICTTEALKKACDENGVSGDDRRASPVCMRVHDGKYVGPRARPGSRRFGERAPAV